MPLKGSGHSQFVVDQDRYFTSLSELDSWAEKPGKQLLGVLPYAPRSKVAAGQLQQGKLLVNGFISYNYTMLIVIGRYATTTKYVIFRDQSLN